MCPCSRKASVPPGTEPGLTSPDDWVPALSPREPWAGWLSPLSCCRSIHSSEETRGWQSSPLPPYPLRCLFCAGNRENCHPCASVLKTQEPRLAGCCSTPHALLVLSPAFCRKGGVKHLYHPSSRLARQVPHPTTKSSEVNPLIKVCVMSQMCTDILSCRIVQLAGNVHVNKAIKVYKYSALPYSL